MLVRPLSLFVTAAVFAGCKDFSDGLVEFNTPPAVSIIEPLDNDVFDEGEPIVFRGLVSDNTGVANLTIQWASSIDGILLDTDVPDPNGAVELASASLSAGAHIVTLRAFDPQAAQGEARVNVVIEGVPEAPSIQIEHPVVGETALEAEAYRFMVKVEDEQDPEPDLVVELRSDVHGFVCSMTPDSIGIAYCDEVLPLGEHLLAFSVTDTEGNTNTASAVFEVVSLLDFDADRDGWSPNQGDCNDQNNTIHPGAQEICDNLDNDCNALTAVDQGTICFDDDGDNYCEAPPCRNAAGTLPDCNDAAPGIHPGANETPDNVDNDCNGRVDDGTTRFDDDGDGYCETPPCTNATGLQPDCDDGRFLVNVAQTEICGDGLDNNCNFTQNEQNALGCTRYYIDNDGDTYATQTTQQCWCEPGMAPYTATRTGDCDDANSSAFPGQTQFFGSARANGSYDYNCNTQNERQYVNRTSCNGNPGAFQCDDNGEGWEGTVPACGSAGDWVNGCDLNIPYFAYVICGFSCTINTQSCLTCFLDNDASCDKEFGTGRVQGCR
jgi:hypothetical protein